MNGSFHEVVLGNGTNLLLRIHYWEIGVIQRNGNENMLSYYSISHLLV